MNDVGLIIVFFSTSIVAGLVPPAVLLFVPSWKDFGLGAFIIASPLAVLWTDHFHATNQPNFDNGPLGFLVVYWFACFTAAAGIGIVVVAYLRSGWSQRYVDRLK